MELGPSVAKAKVTEQEEDCTTLEHGGLTTFSKTFERMYTQQGLGRFSTRVVQYTAIDRVTPLRFKVKDLGCRWDCFSSNDSLIFCHGSHDGPYRNVVDRVMPDYRERKAWLRGNWANLGL